MNICIRISRVKNNGGGDLKAANSKFLYFKIIATYIGSVIGAGFASGQEILQFFIMFGDRAIYGIILCTLLFAYLGAVVLYVSSSLETDNYKGLFKYLFGRHVNKLMDVTSLLMLIAGLGIMLAGSGAIFSEHFGFSKFWGVILVAGITMVVIYGGLQRMMMINAFLVPVKIVLIIMLCTWVLINVGSSPKEMIPEEMIKIAVDDKVAGHWAWSAVLYVSYNMMIAVAVLSSLGQVITKKHGLISGVAGGLFLGLTAGIITLAGLAFYPVIINYQVPLLYMAGQVNEVWLHLLGIIIWLAILTSAIANAHGFASRLAFSSVKRYKIIGIAVTLFTIPLAGVDFAQLVRCLYPVFGYAGLLLVFALAFFPVYRRFFRV